MLSGDLEQQGDAQCRSGKEVLLLLLLLLSVVPSSIFVQWRNMVVWYQTYQHHGIDAKATSVVDLRQKLYL